MSGTFDHNKILEIRLSDPSLYSRNEPIFTASRSLFSAERETAICALSKHDHTLGTIAIENLASDWIGWISFHAEKDLKAWKEMSSEQSRLFEALSKSRGDVLRNDEEEKSAKRGTLTKSDLNDAKLSFIKNHLISRLSLLLLSADTMYENNIIDHILLNPFDFYDLLSTVGITTGADREAYTRITHEIFSYAILVLRDIRPTSGLKFLIHEEPLSEELKLKVYNTGRTLPEELNFLTDAVAKNLRDTPSRAFRCWPDAYLAGVPPRFNLTDLAWQRRNFGTTKLFGAPRDPVIPVEIAKEIIQLIAKALSLRKSTDESPTALTAISEEDSLAGSDDSTAVQTKQRRGAIVSPSELPSTLTDIQALLETTTLAESNCQERIDSILRSLKTLPKNEQKILAIGLLKLTKEKLGLFDKGKAVLDKFITRLSNKTATEPFYLKIQDGDLLIDIEGEDQTICLRELTASFGKKYLLMLLVTSLFDSMTPELRHRPQAGLRRQDHRDLDLGDRSVPAAAGNGLRKITGNWKRSKSEDEDYKADDDDRSVVGLRNRHEASSVPSPIPLMPAVNRRDRVESMAHGATVRQQNGDTDPSLQTSTRPLLPPGTVVTPLVVNAGLSSPEWSLRESIEASPNQQPGRPQSKIRFSGELTASAGRATDPVVFPTPGGFVPPPTAHQSQTNPPTSDPDMPPLKSSTPQNLSSSITTSSPCLKELDTSLSLLGEQKAAEAGAEGFDGRSPVDATVSASYAPDTRPRGVASVLGASVLGASVHGRVTSSSPEATNKEVGSGSDSDDGFGENSLIV
jgi:hypothetical protein